jgi:predicted membrane protein
MFPGKAIVEMIISWMAFLLWAYPIINALLGLHFMWSEEIVFPRTLSSTILGVGAVMKTISWLQSRKPPVVKNV